MKSSQLFGIMLLFITNISYSQVIDSPTVRWKRAMSGNEKILQTLLVLDRNAVYYARVLMYDLSTKQARLNEETKRHSEEIGKTLAVSEEYLTRLGKKTELALDEMGIAYLSGLHRHYRTAIEENKAIQLELIKAAPAAALITMKAQIIYSEVKTAEEELIELNIKAEIKKPMETLEIK